MSNPTWVGCPTIRLQDLFPTSATSPVNVYANAITVASVAGLSAPNYVFHAGAAADYAVNKATVVRQRLPQFHTQTLSPLVYTSQASDPTPGNSAQEPNASPTSSSLLATPAIAGSSTSQGAPSLDLVFAETSTFGDFLNS